MRDILLHPLFHTTILQIAGLPFAVMATCAFEAIGRAPNTLHPQRPAPFESTEDTVPASAEEQQSV